MVQFKGVILIGHTNQSFVTPKEKLKTPVLKRKEKLLLLTLNLLLIQKVLNVVNIFVSGYSYLALHLASYSLHILLVSQLIMERMGIMAIIHAFYPLFTFSYLISFSVSKFIFILRFLRNGLF